MIAVRTKAIPFLIFAVLIAALVACSQVDAAPYTGPIKELPTDHFGREVNETEVERHAGPLLEDICATGTGLTCQAGKESSVPGGFAFPQGITVEDDPASPDYGNIYVADTHNHRVQELTPSGAFVSMFGWDVNETKEKEAAPQAERDTCTAISKDTCKAGTAGEDSEQFSGDYSITTDKTTGNLYIQELFNSRVDEYTSEGKFVLMIGKNVNQTKEKEDAPEAERNICTAASADVCQAGTASTMGNTEKDAFNFAQGFGDLLAVGGPEHLLYVGDEHRIQEFDATTGEPQHEISFTTISNAPESQVVALAVDETGDVFAAYGAGSVANIVYEFTAKGERKEFKIKSPVARNGIVTINGMAIDPLGRLAVIEEELANREAHGFGAIYDSSTGHLITEFADPDIQGAGKSGIYGIAFTGDAEEDKLYAAMAVRQEVASYAPVDVAELLINPVACRSGVNVGTSATFTCGLEGEVNPEEVAETDAWFQWGRTSSFESSTAKQTIADGDALVPVAATVEDLRPDETYYYRVAGEDENSKSPELLTSEIGTFQTPGVQPVVVGEPNASFIGSSSAVMFGELNPEKASTRYEFQYAPESQCGNLESCPNRSETSTLESAAYGTIGATLEAKGLQPGTTYRYRLAAENGSGTAPGIREGSFTTITAPNVQALTGASSMVTSTNATVSGTINPDGQPATYAFELGIENGASTQYGTVFSGPVGTEPVAESIVLTGLQPGVTYAYRIKIKSGYGESVGATLTFTTAGLPEVLNVPTPPAQLVVPGIDFPRESTEKATPKKPTPAEALARALKACEKKPKRQRATCRRQAHKRYVVGKTKPATKGSKGRS